MLRKKNKRSMYYMLGIIAAVIFILMPTKANASTISYSISYSANGGTGAPSTQIKEKNKVIKLSTKIPRKTGHTFMGWSTISTDNKVVYRPGDKYAINKNLRLYAVWKANTYKITYNTNGGGSAPAAQVKTYGKYLSLTTFIPKKTGYTFIGWSENSRALSAKYKSGGTYKENKPITLYAVWKINTYKIIYNANGGKGTPQSQLKVHGQTIILSKQKPERTGYVLKGWSTSKDSPSVNYLPETRYSINKSTVLYAIWQQKTYQINFNLNGGSGSIKSQTKKYGQILKLSKNVPYRSGYKFLGWGDSKSAINISYYPGDEYRNNAAKNLYAMWGKSKSKRAELRKSFLGIGAGIGVVKANFTYTEDYIKRGTQVSFYKHSTCLELNFEKINEQGEFIVRPPMVITHKDGSGKKTELNSFILKKREQAITSADYIFYYSNNEKVTYSNSKNIIGSSGFSVTYVSPWEPNPIEMSISGNELKQINSRKIDNGNLNRKEDGYFYLLGVIENEYIKNNKKEIDNSRSSSFVKDLERKNIVAKNDNIIIYDLDIDCFVKEIKLVKKINIDDIKLIINKLIIEKELYKEAVKAGCEKSIEDTEQYINELRDEIKKTDDYNKYLMFISGTGMNEEEYWSSEIENYRKMLVRKSYLNKLYEEYKKGVNFSISQKYYILNETLKNQMEMDENNDNKLSFSMALYEKILDINEITIIEKEIKKYM